MYLRHLIPIARAARPSFWRTTTRGKKDVPIWRNNPSSFPVEDPFFRRPSRWAWDAGFGWPFGNRAMDEYMREHLQRMETFFRSPLRRSGLEMEGCETNAHGMNADIVQAKFGEEGVHLELNVSHFHPDDLTVRLSDDRLIISGKHSSKPDKHGFVAREFSREFLIPEEVDMDTFSCKMNAEGHLIISAAGKNDAASCRKIDIKQESGEKPTD